MKKLTIVQKKKIKLLKNQIIENNSHVSKYKNYLILVKYLNSILKLKKKEYKKNIFLDYKIDNSKISGKDTIIFSASPALICYSSMKKYCELYKNKKCYALKNEIQYNTSILFKDRQRKQFNKLKAWQLARYFIKIKKSQRKHVIKYLRLNESGEIQKKHMQKINKISEILKKHDIRVYTYTHNKEIEKKDITSQNLIINSSHKNIKLSNKFLSYNKNTVKRINRIKKDKKIINCLADCSKCKACKIENNLTILCKIH